VARFLFIGRAPRNRTARATAELVRIERAKASADRQAAKVDDQLAPLRARAAAAESIVAQCVEQIADMRRRREAGELVDAGEAVAIHARLNEATKALGS
jgi:hypothetical protein